MPLILVISSLQSTPKSRNKTLIGQNYRSVPQTHTIDLQSCMLLNRGSQFCESRSTLKMCVSAGTTTENLLNVFQYKRVLFNANINKKTPMISIVSKLNMKSKGIFRYRRRVIEMNQ